MEAKTTSMRLKRSIYWILGGLLLALSLFAAFLPHIASTKSGKDRLISLLDHQIKGRIELDALSLSWFSPQQLTGLRLFDLDDHLVLSIKDFQTDTPLHSLLSKHLSGKNVLTGLFLEITPFSDGSTNLEHIFSKKPLSQKLEKLSSIKLENVEANFNYFSDLNLHLSGKTTSSVGPGKFELNIVALKGSDDLKIDANVEHFPVLVLDELLSLKDPGLKGALLGLFGETLDIKISQTLEIPKDAKWPSIEQPPFPNSQIQASLFGTNINIAIDGHVQNGEFLLNEPLTGQFQIPSDNASRKLLSRFVPLFGSFIASDRPTKFMINKEGFRLQLANFTAKRLSIGLATLDLNVIHLRNEGDLAKMLSILKPGNTPFIDLWFTPLYLRLNDGILSIERVDALLQNAYPVAAWGSVDLIKNQLNVEIGLSAIMISHAFGAELHDSSAYIPIPLKGSIERPVIDKGIATSRIASAALPVKLGASGAVIGSFVNMITGSSKEAASNVPPPTTSPLPWDGLLPSENEADNPIPNPVKLITERAGKLLNKIIR